MATVEWSRFSCPHCKGSLSRVRRHLGDRTVSLLVPVVRLPEPGSLALIGAGLIGFGALRGVRLPKLVPLGGFAQA
jgi:hypothetical protein